MSPAAVQVTAPDQISALALKALLADHTVALQEDEDGACLVLVSSDDTTRDGIIAEVLSAVERWLEIASVEEASVRIGERLYVMRRDRAVEGSAPKT